MILSMTGYGIARYSDTDLSLTAEVRSVNNRYLKLQFRLPDFLGPLEPDLERLVRQHVTRGAVTVTIHCQRHGSLAAPPINEDVLAGYAEALGTLSTRLGLSGGITMGDLVRLPGVLEEDEPAADVEPLRQRVVGTVGAAVEDFKAMRRQEGKALEEDLRKHLADIRGALERISELAPLVVEEYRDRLMERIEQLMKQSTVEMAAEDLLKEVSVFAERSDISEEIARLRSHIEQFEELLETDQPAGRKLEFLAQEMLREANTTGAKSGHAEISRRVVDVKGAVDRIKEQVMNAE